MSDYGRMPNFDTYGFDRPGGPNYVEPPPPRCTSCGRFLPWEPTRKEDYEERIECDGTATESAEERTGEMLAILGPGTDTYWWSACGSTGGAHKPHIEIMSAGTIFYWSCKGCGEETKDVG